MYARAEPITDVKSVSAYQAVVLGGNAHMSHWLDAAVRFARHHRKEFEDRPVWLFSSGPRAPRAALRRRPRRGSSTSSSSWSNLAANTSSRGTDPDVLSQEDEEAIDAWTKEIAGELLAVQ